VITQNIWNGRLTSENTRKMKNRILAVVKRELGKKRKENCSSVKTKAEIQCGLIPPIRSVIYSPLSD